MDRTRPDTILARRASAGSYLTGFFLAALFTVLAFVAAAAKFFVPPGIILVCIAGLATVQILAHLHYFLHLDAPRLERPNVLTLICTGLILILFVACTLWIMSDLNYRMM